MGEVVHMGERGTAAAAKLLANAALFAVVGAVGESVELGRRLGLTDEQTFNVLARSPLAEQAARRRGSMASGDYAARFALTLARKDADLALAPANSAGAHLPILQAARSWLARAERSGRGASDYTAMLAEITAQAVATKATEPEPTADCCRT
jgi:3-hydroxyisobutyrate dehydrogenase-like beta-hydroxyacid dehydrogenase